ncbi:DUF808 domain-containing protein [Thermomonas hydrothermalis]|uniref:Inner membrane protein YedI n=1 Tax=Thermomonas hydrothermalis TaxID=213588 RepID=A0A1M4Y6M8_9GAMM|nr:DUF808 domain-containing protein [Thermomonas hydrothermalis]SHF01464.1 hypothetical protein SAMN02745204_01622 [Thermomonas hydrothermalis]
MASGFFALLDDIATLLDDVAAMTKVAAKQTAGVLGDDLALNAQQVSGTHADRELPVVWAVAKGSLRNKAILVPAAVVIATLEAWLRGRGVGIPLILPLLMLGGLYLCFEGMEKVTHHLMHRRADADHQHALEAAVADPDVDLVAFERDKIAGAVRTDFILSAEIIVIALGTVADKPLSVQLGVLVAVAVAMTIGVYGLVAGIVKLDDLGLSLARHGGLRARLGRALLKLAPTLMRLLSVAGTAAMFLVGGGILRHGLPALHGLSEAVQAVPPGWLWSALLDAGVGMLAGAIVLALLALATRLRRRAA